MQVSSIPESEKDRQRTTSVNHIANSKIRGFPESVQVPAKRKHPRFALHFGADPHEKRVELLPMAGIATSSKDRQDPLFQSHTPLSINLTRGIFLQRLHHHVQGFLNRGALRCRDIAYDTSKCLDIIGKQHMCRWKFIQKDSTNKGKGSLNGFWTEYRVGKLLQLCDIGKFFHALSDHHNCRSCFSRYKHLLDVFFRSAYWLPATLIPFSKRNHTYRRMPGTEQFMNPLKRKDSRIWIGQHNIPGVHATQQMDHAASAFSTNSMVNGLLPIATDALNDPLAFLAIPFHPRARWSHRVMELSRWYALPYWWMDEGGPRKQISALKRFTRAEAPPRASIPWPYPFPAASERIARWCQRCGKEQSLHTIRNVEIGCETS